ISFGGTGGKTQSAALTNLGINNTLDENSSNKTFPSAKAVCDYTNLKITKNYFVAVGLNGLISSCPAQKNCGDPNNWTSQIVGSSTTTWMSVAYGLDKFVALASDGTIAYSANTISWALTKASNYSCSYINQQSCKLKFLNNKYFVAGGDKNTKAIYSENGINWSAFWVNSSYRLMGLTFGNNEYVFVSNDAAVFRSNSITGGYSSNVVGNGHLIDIVYGDKFVRSGTSGYIAYSTDAINWDQYIISPAEYFENMIYVNGVYIGVTINGYIFKSASGTTAASWSYVKVESSKWLGIASSRDKYITVGQSGIMAYSTDGTNWSRFVNGNTTWGGVTYG
ncbi:MAG: hypothetical protein LBT85_03730, partial [Bifidobacteriaceae bacterium]|nr:hypothetical protein [Bifidobacteriaceae bacterium]